MLGFAAIIGRLIYVQIVRHDHYRSIARGHLENRRELPGMRGSIVDRNNQPIAVDLVQFTLAVRPGQLDDRQAAAKRIAEILKVPTRSLLKKMPAGKPFVYLNKRVSLEQAEKLRSLKLPGLQLEKKFSRYYPYGQQAAQLVGYCDYENYAKGGLELQYDKLLSGQSGWSIYLRDALGNQFPNINFPTVEPQNGLTVETTIDMVYQGILEEELQNAVKEHKAKNGTAVLLNPHTGEVLGMANYPGFNPNQYGNYKLANFRNRVITDPYEPGSTYKMVAMTLLLEQLELDIDNELVYCENGSFKLVNKVIRDHKKFKYLSASQVFEQSSNIGVIKLADKFDKQDFYRYSRDFGFGARSGIDLPAESPGILHQPGNYSKGSIYYMSIGYEVAVTPLQVVSAYAAIANGGMLLQPYVMKRVLNERGEVVAANSPQVLRQVISSETAGRVRKVLTRAVERGTGQTAKLADFSIAGKTGTAQKISSLTKTYSSSSHVGSFVGFFPAEEPRFVMMIVINNPRNGYYGSQVAAPAFKRIARRIAGLPGEDLRPFQTQLASTDLPRIKNYLPAVEGLSVTDAGHSIALKGLSYQVVGEGDMVVRQHPAAYTDLTEVEDVQLWTERLHAEENMPKLTGLSLKEALQVLGQWDVSVSVEGNGIVQKQTPAPGRKLAGNAEVMLFCKP